MGNRELQPRLTRLHSYPQTEGKWRGSKGTVDEREKTLNSNSNKKKSPVKTFTDEIKSKTNSEKCFHTKISYYESQSETPVIKIWIWVLICLARTQAYYLNSLPKKGTLRLVHIKSDKCILTSGVRPVCSHAASSSVVRGLTNWFSDHLGACVRCAMVYPAQKNQNQIWSTEFLWHFLPICSKASTLDPSVSLWQGLSHEYQRGKITDNCFGWKWLFFPCACWLYK